MPYTFFVLLQPAQRCRHHNVVKKLLIAIGSSHADQMRFADLSFHRKHHGVELNVRSRKRDRSDSRNDLLVVGWYEAVLCRN